jgi:large subunit ribosomal protein L20
MRTLSNVARHRKKVRVLRRARGFVGSRHRLWRIAVNAVRRADRYAYIGRKLRKRDFRRLWVQRINAAARAEGLTYSRFMGGLRRAQIDLNRKMLADLALRRPEVFRELVAAARGALA